MTWPLQPVGSGPVPAKINIQLAQDQTFVNLALIGVTSSGYAGGAGYGIPITSGNAADIEFAIGRIIAGTPGTNGAFNQGSVPGIYSPVTTPAGADGQYSADVQIGAFKMLPDSSTPAGSAPCSQASNFSLNAGPVYTKNGQSVLTFSSASAAEAAGYVPCGIQLEYDVDGDGQITVFCHPWLNTIPNVQTLTGVATVAASAGSLTLAGALPGDTVVSVTDLTAPGNVSAAFETTISVSGHIQQLVASGTDGITTSDKVLVILSRSSLI